MNGFRILERAPSRVVDDAGRAQVVVFLELRDDALRLLAEDAVDVLYRVADVLELLLQQHDVASRGIELEDRCGEDRGREQHGKESGDEAGFDKMTPVHTIGSFLNIDGGITACVRARARGRARRGW